MNTRKWDAILTGIILGALFVLIAHLAHAADTLHIDRTSVRMATDRHINALWVSVPTAAVERGSGIPLTWSWQVNDTAIPGVTYVSSIAPCSVEYITGSVEVVSGCGEFIYGAPDLSGLQTVDFVQIVTECFGCCCEPTLQISGGCSVAGVDVPEPPTWSTVKGRYR